VRLAQLLNLGLVPYDEAWALQRSLADAVTRGEIPDTVVLLEHPPVITLGRRADDDELHVPAGAEVEVVETNRGGRSTYHGPGQLVAYPIVAVTERNLLLRPLVRALEAAMVETCGAFGVAAERLDGHPGCWCDPGGPAPRKIGALGIRVERGVTYHGIALNVDPDLADFGLIDPCGMPGVVSTSIAHELGLIGVPDRDAAVRHAASVFAASFASAIGAPLAFGAA
jgi:lipoyl(octanoyl) transferase